MHYHRLYRHGSVERAAQMAGISVAQERRYRTIAAKGHPLAGRNGRAYEHRVVLHAVIGSGPHTCHWCCRVIDWLPKGDPRCLVVDHLNGIEDDNRPTNLVPSCAGCNTTRGSQARSAALREAGWWSQNDTIANLTSGGRHEPIVAA